MESFGLADVVTMSAVLHSLPVAQEGGQAIETWAKVVGGVAAAVGGVVGVPYAFLQIQKTRVEIRKLEREADDIVRAIPLEEGYHVSIGSVSEDARVHIQILADPRFLGPLLLLLDFIVAWIVLTLCGVAFSILDFGVISQIALAALAAFLLVPIFREARRIKRRLHGDPGQEASKAGGG